MSIRIQDVMLYGGGECLQQFGTPFWRVNRGQDVPATMTRSGAVGSFVDKDGVIRQASANRLRIDWAGGVPYMLLEEASTNVYDFSDDPSDVAWTKARSSVSQNAIMSPAGVASASNGVYELIEDNTAGQHYIEQTLPALTNDTDQSAGFWVRPSNHLFCYILTISKANRSDVTWFSLSGAGSVGTQDADHVRVSIERGPKAGALYWYRVSVTWDAQSGGTTPRALCGLTASDGVSSYTGDGSSKILIWNPQFEVDKSSQSSAIITTSAADQTRNADMLSVPNPYPPQAETGYLKFIERGGVLSGASARVFNLGGNANSQLFVSQLSGAGVYLLKYTDLAGSAVTSTLATAPEFGDLVELLWKISAAGVVQISQSINSATPVDAPASAALDLEDAWNSGLAYIGSTSSGSQGNNAFAAVKRVRGDASWTDMRALFALGA